MSSADRPGTIFALAVTHSNTGAGGMARFEGRTKDDRGDTGSRRKAQERIRRFCALLTDDIVKRHYFANRPCFANTSRRRSCGSAITV